jgi:nucleoside-diphosphate-sugar epimerase
MKVAIAGGAGFIGLNLARALVARGTLSGPSGSQEDIDSILLFDRTIPEERPAGLDDRVVFRAGDISDRDTVFGLVDRDDISVFHLASVVSAGGERDFDLAMRVNLEGGRNILEAARARGGMPRVVFASSVAVFGGSAMPSRVSDFTKQTPRTTYGTTKAICELLVNDYTLKGFIDGRTVRLPTIFIRPGKPNLAASSFASGVFREPLNGEDCLLPVRRETKIALLGYRNAVKGFIGVHELDSGVVGDDRAINLPSSTYDVHEMEAALQRVATSNGIAPGAIVDQPDSAIQAIVDSWAIETETARAESLGLPGDVSLDRVIQDYIDDFLPGL